MEDATSAIWGDCISRISESPNGDRMLELKEIMK